MVLLGFVVLVIIVCFLAGISLSSLVLGTVLSAAILAFMPALPSSRLNLPPFAQATRFLRNLTHFMWDFLKDLWLSNIVVAKDVWTPTDFYRPRLAEVFVGDLTDFEIALLATRITLTPGTLSADLSEDRQHLIVHVMYPAEDSEAALRKPIDMLLKGRR